MKYQTLFCLVAIGLMVGTVSADTLLKYLDEDTADEAVSEGTNAIWTTLRNDVGDVNVDGVSTQTYIGIASYSTPVETYDILRRLCYGFNTSSIPDGAIISSAKLGVYPRASFNALNNQNLGVTGFAPAAANDFVAGDYDSFGNVRYADDVAYASVPVNTAYLNISFNSAGIANVSKTGYTNFMLRLSSDIDNSNSTLTWLASSVSGFRIYDYTESVGKEPFLEIVYSTAVSPVASFTIPKTFLRIPNSVTVTDTSTNTPTSWAWSWGDGTANSTTQNPTHQYLKRGKWDIILTATNAGGSGTSAATSVRVAGYENYT